MKKIKNITLLVLSLVLVSSCLSNEEKKKKAEEEGNALVSIKAKLLKGAGDALKKDGKEAVESATEGIGEIVKGVSNGYDKSIHKAKIVSDSLFLQKFDIGRTEKVYNDTTKVKKVIVYLVPKQDFKGKIKLKAFDAAKSEIGRSVMEIDLKEDEAKYFDFAFDNRTPLLQADYFTIESK